MQYCIAKWKYLVVFDNWGLEYDNIISSKKFNLYHCITQKNLYCCNRLQHVSNTTFIKIVIFVTLLSEKFRHYKCANTELTVKLCPITICLDFTKWINEWNKVKFSIFFNHLSFNFLYHLGSCQMFESSSAIQIAAPLKSQTVTKKQRSSDAKIHIITYVIYNMTEQQSWQKLE